MNQNNALKVLSIPSYRFFLATRLFLTFGLQMQAVIIGWEVYKISNDALSLGLVGLAEAIPAISIALYAGHIAVVYNRKTILQVSLLFIIISTIGLYAALENLLPGNNSLIWVYTFICVRGFARGFYASACFVTISQLVP